GQIRGPLTHRSRGPTHPRTMPNTTIQRILLPLALSPRAQALAAEAKRLATALGAEVCVVHNSPSAAQDEAKVRDVLAQAGLEVSELVLRSGKPDREILR